ncbi:MAG: hypothetical protein LQ344_005492 [Seirophora lacunosa]|nr:MAG: hypothetical protein LQ344_005492 [Seirophora lacunosa]
MLGDDTSRPADIPTLSPQCSACLTPATVSHCAVCWGTRIPLGQAPHPYSSLPSVSRDDLCTAARQIPDAECIVDAFCPVAEHGAPAAEDDTPAEVEPGDLALIEDIIAGLSGAVGTVDVQQGPAVGNGGAAAGGEAPDTGGNTTAQLVTGSVSVATPSSSSSASITTSRARGLCGRYWCFG